MKLNEMPIEVSDGFNPFTELFVQAEDVSHSLWALRIMQFCTTAPPDGWTAETWAEPPSVWGWRCRLVVVPSLDIWMYYGEGLWLPVTEAGGQYPTPQFGHMMRKFLWNIKRETDKGVKTLDPTDSLLGHIIREMAAMLISGSVSDPAAYPKVMESMDIQTLKTAAPLDRPERYLAAANGLVDVVEREVTPYDQFIFIAGRLSASYRPDLLPGLDAMEYLERLRETIVSDTSAQISLLQEMIGYGFGFSRRHHFGLQLVGTRRSMKGTTLTSIQAIGGTAVASFSLGEFGQDRSRSTTLNTAHGRRMVLEYDAPKPDRRTSKRVSVDLKAWTAYEPMTWQTPYARSATTAPMTALPVLASNITNQRWSDTDSAMASRWKTVTFEKSAEDLPGGVDADLARRMKLPANLDLFLLWAAEGLRRVLVNDSFTATVANEDAKLDVIRSTTPYESFIDECVVFTGRDDHVISSTFLRIAYITWAREHDISTQKITGLSAPGSVRILRKMAERKGVIIPERLGKIDPAMMEGGFDYSTAFPVGEGSPKIKNLEQRRARGYVGLKLVSPVNEDDAIEALTDMKADDLKRLLGRAVNPNLVLELMASMGLSFEGPKEVK